VDTKSYLLHSVEVGFILSPKGLFICVLILKGLVIGCEKADFITVCLVFALTIY